MNQMTSTAMTANTNGMTYAQCIEASRRMRWDIDADVLRGRQFDTADKFLPDGLTGMGDGCTLSADDQRLISQIQGRTYAGIFGVAERFVNAKIVEMQAAHVFDDQTALEALVRFSDEELKHQELFRRVEALCEQAMPKGYVFAADPNDVARAVMSKSTWAVLALTLHIELFTRSHYRESIDGDAMLSPLYKDVFKYHWREECQHAMLDELEFRRVDAETSDEDRDQFVTEFIELVGAVDGILQAQAEAGTTYFTQVCGRMFSAEEQAGIHADMLKAYRWTYILSGAAHRRFQKVMGELCSPAQMARISEALEGRQ